MKKHIILIFVILTGLYVVFVPGENLKKVEKVELSVKPQEVQAMTGGSVQVDLNSGKFPLYFIFNKGQVNKKAVFYAKASRYTLWITKEGLVFDSVKKVAVKAEEGKQKTDGRRQPTDDRNNKEVPGKVLTPGIHAAMQSCGHAAMQYSPHSPYSPKTHRDVSRLIFLNANRNPEMVPIDETKLRVNYFKGNDRSKWRCAVPTSGAVLYKNLYKNIDLKVYGIEKQIEYDWIVKPGGDPGEIRIQYQNVKSTRLDDEGNLLIETDFGELIHKKPVSYQKIGVGAGSPTCPQERKNVDLTFKKIDKNIYGFAVGDYDSRYELIIDPVILVYSTYLGGSISDSGNGIAVDSTGNVYVTGYTSSLDFPTLNQYQAEKVNYFDAFVTKIDTTQSGTSGLVYSTYLGGEYDDVSCGIAVDSFGNAYIVGYTESTDFPTMNQFQLDPGDWYSDAFVAKLDTTQSGVSSLLYSTYLAGSFPEWGTGIAVDGDGYVYVTGWTLSTDFPVLNQYQTDPDEYQSEVFVTKLDPTQVGASSFIYSTYLGGGNTDDGRGIAVDNNGNAYVTGVTCSPDFPTLNPYQTFQGFCDAFVVTINTKQSGTASLVYSTYLGGKGLEWGWGIAVDNHGYTYVTGWTYGDDFPILNQYQAELKGDADAFVAKINTNQGGTSGLLYSTYLGGQDKDNGFGIAVDGNQYVYVTGETRSTDFPALDTIQELRYMDAFVTKICTTKSGISSLIFSTYLGGEYEDCGRGIAADSNGYIYVTGWTSSEDFPTVNQYQTDPGDYHADAFVTKLFYMPPITVITTPSTTITTTSASSGGEVTYDGGNPVTVRGVCWSISPNPTLQDNFTTDGSGTGVFTSSIIGLTPNTIYYVRAYATNSEGTAYGNEETFETLASLITVSSPNGGENWNVGSVYDITWTSEGTVGNVMIEYSINGGTSWKIIVQSTENDGIYKWKVPNRPSDNCLVRISETDEDGSPSDISDAAFSIVSPVTGTLTLRTPNGGETWLAGSTQEIKWNSTGDINYVNIKYSKDNGTTWKTIAQNVVNSHSYNWVVPGTASDKCLVRIAANDNDPDPKPADVSDAVFSIVLPPSPTIRVIAPNGGEQLEVGSLFTVTWDAANTRADVRIEYSVNGGETWKEIIAAAGNNGKYDWIVPDDPSENCRVRISETDGQPSDVSDALFSIVSPVPGDITVISPNGGETWTAGSSQEIKWTAVGIDHVKIEYSQDHGNTWKSIIQTTPNSGSFNWTVPGIASNECLVRITSNDANSDPIPADISDAVFSIVPPASPTITVIAPNGGEQLLVGSRFNIAWNAINSREDVKIEYSVNGGEQWIIITDAADNNGDYAWFVPDTPSETCLVRISETDGQPVDVSDAVFSIVQSLPGEVTVISPNGGESWTVGSLQEIKWTAGGINNVTIECSTDYGTTWQVIVQTTPNNGSFDWTIPNTVSDECLVRVSSNDGDPDPVPSDVSDRVFSITPGPSGEFRVTSPNGGEEWDVGTTQSIKWTNTGDINTVMIEYSYDNGNTWNTIVSSLGNSGNYDWTIPNTVSDECLVRVIANDGEGDPQPTDVSDAVFSILRPSSPTIRVITPNGGEQLVIGAQYEITWFGTDSRAEVKIEYSINGGETWTGIIGPTENDGEYDWLVPDEPSETCLVRISEIDGEPVDVSDAVFSIVQPQTGDLTVLTPNGGENLETGSEYNITWNSSGLNNIIIEYSANNGETWLYIDKVPADNGGYPWTVPGTPSEMCLVRVSGADADENPADVSDGVFTIFDPSQASIEVFTPNGGENLGVGEEYYITWASSGINTVKIEYSTNNGEQWVLIDTVSALGGRFTWTIPDTPSASSLIQISGADSPGDPLDVSDAVFSIITNFP